MALIQYIIVRKDLGWPIGALMAQACHASVAVLTKFKDDQQTKDYLADLESMHKVVLEANEKEFNELNESFSVNKIDYYLWKEMPENIASAISTKPYQKKLIAPLVKHLKLYD